MKSVRPAIQILLLAGASTVAYVTGFIQASSRDDSTHDKRRWGGWGDYTLNINLLHPQTLNYSEAITAFPTKEELYKADGSLRALLSSAHKVCFIGDSITAGSENGGFPWYKPLVKAFPELGAENLAIGGGTSKSLLEISRTQLPTCDVYIIALGTNDVRYRNAQRGAITPEEYIGNLSGIVKLAKKLNKDSRFVFIAPWCSIPEAPIPPISRKQKEQLLAAYSETLSDYCTREDFLYINPNTVLSTLLKYPPLRQHYISDHIHPTWPYGCYLYSAAVWEEGNKTCPPALSEPAGK